MASPAQLQNVPGFPRSDDRTGQLIASSIVCTILAILAVMLRLYARSLTKVGLGKDDYMMLLGLTIYITFEVIEAVSGKYGVGRHIVYVTDPYHVGVFLLTDECLYAMLAAIIETSILLHFHRLFPQKKFSIYLWIVGVWLWLSKLPFVIATIFQCIPIQKLWDPSTPGHCFSFYIAGMTAAVLNVVTNLVILLMPIPIIWRLNMSRKSRLQVIFAFTIGGLTCIAGLVRVAYTPGLTSTDITWDVVPSSIGCAVEGCLFVISGCIPTYVAIITRWSQKSRNQESTGEYHQSRSMFIKRSQDYGVSSFVPRDENSTELGSTNNLSDTDQVKVTTDITTMSELKG